jgi:phosphatidate phosphatase APP1
VRGRALRKSGETHASSHAVSKNLRRLLENDPYADAVITVELGGASVQTRTDDRGLFEARFTFEAPLAPGEHPVLARGPKGLEGRGAVTVIAPGQLLVVSDFDDTVANTGVTDTLALVDNALAQTEETQAPVPGMSGFYQCLRQRGAAFLYLSGSPIEFYPRLRAFLGRNGFPAGGIHLRHLRLGNTDPQGFKGPALAQLVEGLPEARFLFVGDSGERDPEVYAQAASKAGARSAGVFIHRVGEADARAARFAKQQLFDAGAQAAAAAAAQGLIDEACAAALAPKPKAP